MSDVYGFEEGPSNRTSCDDVVVFRYEGAILPEIEILISDGIAPFFIDALL